MNNERLAQTAVGTGSGTLVYTSPGGYRTELGDISIANTTTSSINFTLHLVPSGGSPSSANMMFPAVTVPANTLVQWEGSQIMNSSDFLQGIGSVAGITVTIAGSRVRVAA